MSSALVLAAITTVLKSRLDILLARQSAMTNIGQVLVSALPPDRIAMGAEERNQLNLYLYRVTPYASLRQTLQRADHSLERPSLALDLHYLVTAYGERDVVADILLGWAMQSFHTQPILSLDDVSAAQASSQEELQAILRPALDALAASLVGTSAPPIHISPEFLSLDELSKIWSSLQARSRPSMTYKISTVVIED